MFSHPKKKKFKFVFPNIKVGSGCITLCFLFVSYFEEERLRLCMQKADGDGPGRPFHLVFHVPMRALLEAIDSNPAELAALLIVRGI